MRRKEFINRCMMLAAGCVSVDVLTGCTSLPIVSHVREGSKAIVTKSSFEDKEYVLIEVDELPAPVFISKQSEEEYAAVLLKCTHRGCQVQPAGEIMECPCHGSRYSRTGSVLRGPAPKDLMQYSTVVTTDSIHVLVR